MKPSLKTTLTLALSITLVVCACQKLDVERIMVVETKSVSDITGTTANVKGEIIDLGEGMTDHGVFFSTSPNAKSGSKVSVGAPTGTGEYTVLLSNLIVATKYYYCAYGSDGNANVYGDEASFTTYGLPTVTTTAVSSSTAATATCGGNVTSDGGKPVTARGECWSTNPNPTIVLSTKTTDGNGLGTFFSSITGLTDNTTYYIRAYATNSVGTSYGNEVVYKHSLPIGSNYPGGVIAYIFRSGDPGYVAGEAHGLIAAPSDQSAGIPWGCINLTIGFTFTELGYGSSNTQAIINACNNLSAAARICADLVLNGYSDWYLPSKDELNKLYLAKDVIGGFAEDSYYWSSSEYSDFRSWATNFSTHLSLSQTKDMNLKVRAIRSF